MCCSSWGQFTLATSMQTRSSRELVLVNAKNPQVHRWACLKFVDVQPMSAQQTTDFLALNESIKRARASRLSSLDCMTRQYKPVANTRSFAWLMVSRVSQCLEPPIRAISMLDYYKKLTTNYKITFILP